MTTALVKNKSLHFESQRTEYYFYEKMEGKTVVIQEKKKKRSLSQNAYLWFIYTLIAEHTGNDPEDIHEYCKTRALPKRFIKINGKEREIPPSTRILSKGDFAMYIEKVCALAANLEIRIPTPEEAGYIPH